MRKGKIFLIAGVTFILLAACFNNEPTSKKSASQSSSNTVPVFYMYVKSDGLNVRKASNADASIVTVIYQNDKVATDKVSHNGWYKVTAPDKSYTGYVNAAYLSDKPLSEAEIAALKAETAAKAAEAKKAADQAARTQLADSAGAESETVQASEIDVPVTPRATLTKRPKN